MEIENISGPTELENHSNLHGKWRAKHRAKKLARLHRKEDKIQNKMNNAQQGGGGGDDSYSAPAPQDQSYQAPAPQYSAPAPQEQSYSAPQQSYSAPVQDMVASDPTQDDDESSFTGEMSNGSRSNLDGYSNAKGKTAPTKTRNTTVNITTQGAAPTDQTTPAPSSFSSFMETTHGKIAVAVGSLLVIVGIVIGVKTYMKKK